MRMHRERPGSLALRLAVTLGNKIIDRHIRLALKKAFTELLRPRDRVANRSDAKLPIIEFDNNVAAPLKPDCLAEHGWDA
jgi:hypothetical protein